MKLLLPTLLALFFLSACSDSIDDSSKRNENWCWFVNKETGKGEWVPVTDEANLPDGDYTLFYKSGKIYQTGKIKDKKDCDTLYYYQIDGKVLTKEIKLTDSTSNKFWADGKYKAYYQTGEVSGEGEFIHNKQIGLRIGYYINGKVKFRSFMKGDTELLQTYYKSGIRKDSIASINKLAEGIAKEWYSNGQLNCKVQFLKGKKTGDCIWYFKNGKVEQKAIYENDTIEGHFVFYYENGQIMDEGTLKNHKKDGLIVVYTENGIISDKVNFLNDLENGDFWYYYPNGHLKRTGKCKDGKVVYCKYYDEKERLRKEYNGKDTIRY